MMENTRKTLDYNFEMNIEEILGINKRPLHTCDFNYPILKQYEAAIDSLRDALSSAPESTPSFHPEISISSHLVDHLEEAIDDFSLWADDWIELYHHSIKPYISDSEIQAFTSAISEIECVINDAYSSAAVHESIDALYQGSEDVDKCIYAAHTAFTDNEDDIQTIKEDIEHVQQHIELTYDEYEQEALQSSITDLEQSLGRLENESPWSPYIRDAEQCLDALEHACGIFGANMESHYTRLRACIDNFVVMASHFLENGINKSNPEDALRYPVDVLNTLIEDHSEKDVILVAASPEIFIRRVRRRELNTPKLSSEDSSLLLSRELNSNVFAMAVKRFLLDYPEYDRILCYVDNDQARCLGKREFISLAKYKMTMPDCDKKGNIEACNPIMLQNEHQTSLGM